MKIVQMINTLAGVSGFFGIVGMTSIFVAAALPIMVMVGALEAAKLVTCAWLVRHWRVTPLLLRTPLTVMVLAIGSAGIGTSAGGGCPCRPGRPSGSSWIALRPRHSLNTAGAVLVRVGRYENHGAPYHGAASVVALNAS